MNPNNVPPMPIETHIALEKEKDRLQTQAELRDFLLAKNHFHRFGPSRVCVCGMNTREYFIHGYQSSEPCPEVNP